MGKVIILEGPDGCGKTNLAKKLQSHGWVYRHEGPPLPGVDLIDHYLSILYDSLIGPNDVVHDRLHLGETIYGPIVRGSDRLGSKGLRLFERLHQSKAVTQIICLTDFQIAKEVYNRKMAEADDYLKSHDKWVKVYEAYKRRIGSPIHKEKDWRQFNYKHDNVSDLLDLVHIHSAKTLPVGAIGSLTAQYLFIGDKPNHDYVDIPFFATTGPSGYLNKALELAHFTEDSIALYNANDCYGVSHKDPTKVFDALPNLKHMFVLGNEARNYLQDFSDEVSRYVKGKDMIFHYLPHPSYMKRFRGNNPVVMAEMIRSAVDGRID